MLSSRLHESSLTAYERDNLRTIANDSSSIARHLADISGELKAIRTAVEADKRDREFARPMYLMAIGTGTLYFRFSTGSASHAGKPPRFAP